MNTLERSSISMNQLKNLIKCNLQTLWSNDNILADSQSKQAAMVPPLMIWGAPGLGKSTVVREVAEELNINFIDVRLAQRDPVDMRGLPVPENDRVKWIVSSEWPRDPNSKGIIMFDELTAADRTLQVASYEFILDRRLGDLYKVPDGWYILAAGNRTEDKAVACAMSSALANRFLHVEVKAETESFISWAVAHKLHPAVINFIRFRPNKLFSQENEDLQRGWPSPRSWERVSSMLKIADYTNNKDILEYAIPGLIGEKAAGDFMTFLSTRFYMIEKSDVKERLLQDEVLPIPSRTDMLYACCGAISYHIETEQDSVVLDKLLTGALKFALTLTSDFSVMLMTDIVSGLKRSGEIKKLVTHPLYKKWRDKFQKA